MKTFEEALNKAIDNFQIRSGMEGVGYIGGFVDGLEHAQELLDMHRGAAINEILTGYYQWVEDLPPRAVAKWYMEEGDLEKTNARTRKEFIEFLNKQNKSK